jgi:hypothetical protein
MDPKWSTVVLAGACLVSSAVHCQSAVPSK